MGLHKFVLYKVFYWKDIPLEISKHFVLNPGHSILFNIDTTHSSDFSKNLSKWCIESGALDMEKVFIYRD